jgi:hypothetical protein
MQSYGIGDKSLLVAFAMDQDISIEIALRGSKYRAVARGGGLELPDFFRSFFKENMWGQVTL